MYFGEPNEVVVVANKRQQQCCKLLVELSGHSGGKIRLKFNFYSVSFKLSAEQSASWQHRKAVLPTHFNFS